MRKKTETYGLQMNGLRNAATLTKKLTDEFSGHYYQIGYNTRTGTIYTDYHYSLGQNSWTVYRDPDVIKVLCATRPMTMQEIADAIAEAVTAPENTGEFYEGFREQHEVN